MNSEYNSRGGINSLEFSISQRPGSNKIYVDFWGIKKGGVALEREQHSDRFLVGVEATHVKFSRGILDGERLSVGWSQLRRGLLNRPARSGVL